MNKLLILIIAGLALGACSVKRTAVNIIGDALSGGGGVYASDGDPDLIRETVPSALKTYESLLDGRDWAAALAMTDGQDVAFLYWAGAAWAGALSAAKDDLGLIAELPTAAALVGRVLELDEAYEQGAAHEFFVSYEGGRPGGSVEKARMHYRRALALSGGTRASVHLALAEAVTIQEQNLAEFRALVAAVRAVDLDQAPQLRLVNTLAQRRARWLELRIPDLFLEADDREDLS